MHASGRHVGWCPSCPASRPIGEISEKHPPHIQTSSHRHFSAKSLTHTCPRLQLPAGTPSGRSQTAASGPRARTWCRGHREQLCPTHPPHLPFSPGPAGSPGLEFHLSQSSQVHTLPLTPRNSIQVFHRSSRALAGIWIGSGAPRTDSVL